MNSNFLYNFLICIFVLFSSSISLYSIPLDTDTFSKIIEKSSSGVVSIKAYTKTSNITENSYFTSSNKKNSSQDQEADSISLGSGFIIKIVNENIYILTTYHVVSGYNYITTIFYNGLRYKSKLYKYDSDLDLAILIVPYSKEIKEKLPGIKSLYLEDKNNIDRIKPGDFILSIGNLNGFNHTSSMGIISFIGRKIKKYNNLIQLDIRIDSGSSGSPVLNLDSKVIGICVGINNSLSFAIPTKTIHSFLSKINFNK